MSLWIHGVSHIDKACSANGERNHEMYKQRGSSDVGFIFGLALVVFIISAWITHVVVCLKTDSWGFLIAGAIMFPVAVIHGFGVWLGIW